MSMIVYNRGSASRWEESRSRPIVFVWGFKRTVSRHDAIWSKGVGLIITKKVVTVLSSCRRVHKIWSLLQASLFDWIIRIVISLRSFGSLLYAIIEDSESTKVILWSKNASSNCSLVKSSSTIAWIVLWTSFKVWFNSTFSASFVVCI